MTMKKSNIMLLGAGAVLVVMLLASVITARVVFDRALTQDSPSRNVIYINQKY